MVNRLIYATTEMFLLQYNKMIVRLPRLAMSNERVSPEEITKQRTPSELWNWLIKKVKQICSTQEGIQDFRLQKGLIKQLVEEIGPLAIFGMHKYADNDQILLQPVIGNQPYDAVVTDLRTKPASQTYIEITQSHEGENDYWRRCELLKKGYVFSYAPVIKTGAKKTKMQVSIPPKATSVEERVRNELERIRDAAKRKEGKDYPTNTSLIIFFDDTPPFQEVIDNKKLDSFVNENILNLGLRFSALYLVGSARVISREYSLIKKI